MAIWVAADGDDFRSDGLIYRSAMVLGFQLFCVLVNAFSPSTNFEPFVRDFLARHIEQNIKGIGIMALCRS
jgi:hypothetical protein